MSNDTTTFARWRWAPRTSQSTVEAAYAIERFPAPTKTRSPQRIADVVLGVALGILGAASFIHWWSN